MEGRREVEMTIREIDDSQLLVAPEAASRGGDTCMVDVEVGVVGMLTSAAGDGSAPVSGSGLGVVTGKRKRGRPPRGQGRVVGTPRREAKKEEEEEEEEEDVCFICFDGGSLVLCDRRGCPKAYHPACIKRDDAFFRSKAKWNCGWHICSSCQKASHHMCYTCTYSLCKGCTRNADYFSVRGNKGFCGTCMRTIMLIENIALGNKETIQVDFDDKASWEYLFKIYWVCLKNQLSLTLDELLNAKRPWKGDELPKDRSLWSGDNGIVPKGVHLSEFNIASDEKCSKMISQPDLVNKENSVVIGSSGVEKSTYLPPKGTTWATKELLEFVAHMKNGDVSILSQFDVQDLLLDYIKRNNLHDPRQKNQIVCDSRLMTLFGKTCVGHFEMMKLLEYHFLKKEKSAVEEPVRAGTMDAVSSRVDGAAYCGNHVMTGSDRRRKARKKSDERGSSINANPEEYAAIDVHNINLLYLKRSLIDKLLEDADKFHEKVVGSFVRIKISGGDQKLDAYRLVQVIGTSKVTEAYTVGTRTTDVMLEILNLDKKEIVSIDAVSNQDFSKDECRHLRQSMKCGLMKRPTVGEILGKAMMLQAVKVSDWLEAEILRLNHLRDRASEKGKRKQLRECVEKLELLNSPNEWQRRLLEIPKVCADSNTDPSYESEEESGVTKQKRPGGHVRARNASLRRKVSQCSSNGRGSSVMYDMGNKAPSYQSSEKCQVGVSSSMACEQSNQAVRQSEMSMGIALAAIPPTVPEGGANGIKTEKLWHYQDPTGKVQGPFAMMQLRKWSGHGLFPLDLRVWRVDERQDDSVLLTDALVGRYRKELPLTQEVPSASTNNDKSWESGSNLNQSNDASWADSKIVESKSVQNYSNALNNPKSNSELMNTIFGSDSPSWTTSVAVTAVENAQPHSSIQGCDMSNTNLRTDKSQLCSKYSPPSSAGKPCEIPSPQERKDHGDEKLSCDFSDVKDYLTRTAEGQSHAIEVEEKRAESEVFSSHSPGQNWGPLAKNSSSSGWASSSGVGLDSKNAERLKNKQELDFSDSLNPTPEQSNTGLDVQPAGNQPPASSNIPHLGSGPSWSAASSIVVGGAQLPGVRGERCGYATTPAKPSIDGWDSNLVPESSMRPIEVTNDHAATPTSGSGQLTQCSETHLTIDAYGFDESVSDLLAEVEAMESLCGLPSPTSRMTSGGELAQCSDNDCFSPGEDFGPMPDLGKNDALSSTGDVRIHSNMTVENTPLLELSLAPSHPAIGEQLGIRQMPSRLTITHEPLHISHIPSHSSLTNELWTSHMHHHSNLMAGPVELPQTASGQSSNSAEVDWDTKLSDVSVNQQEAGSKLQAPRSLNFAGEKAVSDSQNSPKLNPDAYSGNVKGSANITQGSAAKGQGNMIWGSGHGIVQHQTSPTMANATGSAGSWAGNLRHGGEISSSVRDNRSYHQQSIDLGFGRDRASWNRQPLLGVGNGGHSYRPPPKGQRMCKYYESGNCRKGASCTYWHPGP